MAAGLVSSISCTCLETWREAVGASVDFAPLEFIGNMRTYGSTVLYNVVLYPGQDTV